MSTDDKWLDIGHADFQEIAEEFNEHAPYGLNHRREVSFSFELAEDQLKTFMSEVFANETAYAEIRRLFKPLPHTD